MKLSEKMQFETWYLSDLSRGYERIRIASMGGLRHAASANIPEKRIKFQTYNTEDWKRNQYVVICLQNCESGVRKPPCAASPIG